MSKKIYDCQLVLLFTGIWLILFEQLSILHVISGIIVSYIAIRISERFFLGCTFYSRYYFNIFGIIPFFIILIFEIYKAGFNTLLKVISGNVHTDVVTITTELDDDFKKSILANAITLTPGTVTLDITGQQLKVLWLDVKTKHPTMAGQIIKGSLERKL